jgi:hypothetical protein
MITEDYVSFEIAKLLKEKGFHEDCKCQYGKGGSISWTSCNNGNVTTFARPTIQMTMKWLREVHNIDIFPWKIGKGIYSCAIFNSNTGQDLSSNKDFPSEKYEETVESAIKYCLENLI